MFYLQLPRADNGVSQVAQMVKNIPANAGNAGSISGSERPLEKEIATHSSILAWEIPWTEEPGELQSIGLQKGQIQLNN